MFDVRGFHDVTLHASNVAELLTFYEQLGFPRVAGDGTELAVLLVGEHELAIHRAPYRPRGAVTLSLHVDNLSSVQRALEEYGVPFEGPRPLRPGYIGVQCKDPNDNTLEFLAAAH